MKARNQVAAIALTLVVMAGCFVPRASSQAVQPGVSPSPGKYPAEGTVDTPPSTETPPSLPSGWATAEDGNGCQWAVPGGWYFVKNSRDTLRDGGSKAKASLQGEGFQGDWDAYKKLQKQRLHATQTLADSADRLWLAYSQPDGGLHYFVATLGTLFVCKAHIDVPEKGELKTLTPVAKRMAMSIRPSVR